MNIFIFLIGFVIVCAGLIALGTWLDKRSEGEQPYYGWLPKDSYNHKDLGNGWVIFKQKIDFVEYRFMARRDATHHGRDLLVRIENDR